MKVIFLDFDGVLNSAGSFLYEDRRRKQHKEQGVKGPVNETLCHVCTSNFQAVLDKYKDVKIVISSTWRTMFDLPWLKAKLESYHIDSSRVIGVTPNSGIFDGSRGREIAAWLYQNKEMGITHYVIIDDNDWDITPHHGAERFVKTTWESGMTIAHTAELAEKLSNFHKKKCEELAAQDKAEYDRIVAESKANKPVED